MQVTNGSIIFIWKLLLLNGFISVVITPNLLPVIDLYVLTVHKSLDTKYTLQTLVGSSTNNGKKKNTYSNSRRKLKCTLYSSFHIFFPDLLG